MFHHPEPHLFLASELCPSLTKCDFSHSASSTKQPPGNSCLSTGLDLQLSKNALFLAKRKYHGISTRPPLMEQESVVSLGDRLPRGEGQMTGNLPRATSQSPLAHHGGKATLRPMFFLNFLCDMSFSTVFWSFFEERAVT